MILPARCSRSAGLHGQSKSWLAYNSVCTFVPAPIFGVEPKSILTSPFLTLENRSFFLTSVSALWINSISFSGIPLAISLSLISVYTLNVPSFLGVDKSQNTSCVPLMLFVSSQTLKTSFAQVETFEFSSSESIELISL